MKFSECVIVNPVERVLKGKNMKKISMDKLSPYTRDVQGFDIESYFGGSKFRNKDTLMARITPCLENGKIAQVNVLSKDEVGFGSTEFIVFRAKEGITDPDFVYYLVKSDLIRIPAIKSMVGSSGRQRVQTDVIGNLELNLPDLITQKKIGRILSSLDDKIELNNRINKNLEEQAQALFKSWFVDFEPFGGVMPSDWKEQNIYTISEIIYGAPFASKLFNTKKEGLPIIRIRDLKTQNFETYTTEVHSKGYLLHKGDIVVGMDGEFRPYLWANEEAWLNQRICVFKNKRVKGKVFLYFVIKPLLNEIEKTQVATTVIHIGKKDFDKFKFYMPSDEILAKFDAITNPIIWKIVENSYENQKLAQLRDILLPKLMTGEIDVDKVEI